jgi:hypothetical protein
VGWDSTRPVPWQRLIREWLIYAAIMSAVFIIFFRGDNVIGAIAGVLISGPLYLAFGAALAKFGYQRQRLKDIRGRTSPAESAGPAGSGDATPSAAQQRSRPAPTSRTGGGGNRPKASSKRKR